MKHRNLQWVVAAAALVMANAFAEPPAVKAAAPGKQLAVAGYTDSKGAPLPGGDTRKTVTSDGTKTTLTLQNLYAYGEAGMLKDESGKRQAWYGSNPEYFRGGTVYALRLGNDWRGGKTAASVDLTADKGVVVLGQGKIGDDTVTITFPGRKAGPNVQYDCQPLNYLIVKADGKRAWIGHDGYKPSNTAAGIGDHMVLANDDPRYPATALCYDAKGQIVPLTPAMRAELAKSIQPPDGSKEQTKAAQDG